MAPVQQAVFVRVGKVEIHPFLRRGLLVVDLVSRDYEAAIHEQKFLSFFSKRTPDGVRNTPACFCFAHVDLTPSAEVGQTSRIDDRNVVFISGGALVWCFNT